VKLLTISAVALLAATGFVTAAPFDMTPEADLRIVEPTTPEDIAIVEVATPPAEPDSTLRFLQAASVRLEGEIDSNVYEVYVTPEQAAVPAKLQLSYVNALVVAPETSRLRIRINRENVLSVPVSASEGNDIVAVDVPAGILRPGFNSVSVSADMRHRTDCSVGSTYELWSDLSGADTYLGFFGASTARGPSRLEELAAVGVDANGETTIRLLIAGLDAASGRLLAAELVQALALDLRAPNPRIEIIDTLSETPEPGVLQVVVGNAASLPSGLGTVAQQAATSTVASFATSHPAHNVLVLSGPNVQNLTEALSFVKGLTTQYAAAETMQGTIGSHGSPMIDGPRTLRFDELGASVASFNGRRYVTGFSFDLPADFYANDYGNARIRLNAAYSNDVLAGSQVDVFVNGSIASSTPILRMNDDLRALAIKVPMSGFRPGRNDVQLAVSLRTGADVACTPGTVTVKTDTRLLIGGDSTFEMPDFGRLGRLPNLAAFAGQSFPYVNSPPHLVVEGGEEGFAAGLTTLARLAAHNGLSIPVQSVSAAAPAPDQPAIFVGAVDQIPAEALMRLQVNQPFANGGVSDDAEPSIESTLQQWRNQDTATPVSFIARTQRWIANALDLNSTSLGFNPMPDAPITPQSTDRALAVQRVQPEGGVWTLVAAPSQGKLMDGITDLIGPAGLTYVEGRAAVLPAMPAAVRNTEPNNYIYLAPDDLSFTNLRNIAANWLSRHALAYAIGMALLGVLLTLATAGMLRIVGRKSE